MRTAAGNDAPTGAADRTGGGGSRKVTAILAGTALAVGGVGAGLAATLTTPGAAPVTRAAEAVSHGSTAPGTIDAATVSAKVDPAVVNINTTLDPLEGGGRAAGTGMILTSNGEILTNNHVVQGADTITVSIPGHGRHLASVIGTVPTRDVALLKVSGLSHLPTVHLADSSTAVVGTPVVAIGNALGLGGSPTVTTGAITATGRTITASDSTGAHQETLHGLLQLDAEIVPGNSGGPLVNANAQVVGMDTAALSSGTVSASVGFAIPSNTLRTISGQLQHHKALTGYIYGRQAFLGVEVVDSSQVSGSSGTSGSPFGSGTGLGPIATTPNGVAGVVVAAVDPGSGAAKAGLVSGDVITAVDGTATTTTQALSKLIQAHQPGQVLSLTVSTQTGTGTVQAHLGMAPVD